MDLRVRTNVCGSEGACEEDEGGAEEEDINNCGGEGTPRACEKDEREE